MNSHEIRENPLESRASLQEIRLRGHKPRHRQDGNWLARHWARPTAVYGTWFALKAGFSANLITALAGIAWFMEAIALGQGTPTSFMFGVGLGFLGFWLDHVDGQVARVRQTDCIEGIFLDFWIHTAHACLRGFGLGWGLFSATDEPAAILIGSSAAFGWVMISHSNDAAYKAIFAGLKKRRDRNENLRFRSKVVESDKKNARHSKSIAAWCSWSLVKLQEPHCVLLIMVPLGFVQFLNTSAGRTAWWAVMIFWGVTSPFVAVVRLMRRIRNDSITKTFDEWFETQPFSDPSDCLSGPE